MRRKLRRILNRRNRRSLIRFNLTTFKFVLSIHRVELFLAVPIDLIFNGSNHFCHSLLNFIIFVLFPVVNYFVKLSLVEYNIKLGFGKDRTRGNINTNFLLRQNKDVYKICILGKYSRLSLDLYLGSRFNILNPMRKKNRYISYSWLCGFKPKPKCNVLNKSECLKDGKNMRSFCYKINSYVGKIKSFSGISNRHLSLFVKLKLLFDIETNPGPDLVTSNTKLNIFTVNCRGLGKLNKFRLMLKKANTLLNENPLSIIMLQETMVKDDNYIKMAWKGKYVFTQGTGNSQGCITLLGNDIIVYNQINFDHRGHYFEVEGLIPERTAIVNIYAPNGYATNKREFYELFLGQIESSPCQNVILSGDFNITLSEEDRHNRNASQGETNLADFLKTKLESMHMLDAWQGYSGMTWKRGGTLSRLDRIFVRLRNFMQVSMNTDWTFCDSDHALVCAIFRGMGAGAKGPKICRLDPQVVLQPESLNTLKNYLIDQLATLSEGADPHLKLEFAKMTIRTKAIELGNKLRKSEINDLKLLNEDILLHERLLKQVRTVEEENEIVSHLERQTNEKDRILNNQGKALAWKTRTKWYNEGEKSNKYFLNLLKGSANRVEMPKLLNEGRLIVEPKEISKVVNLYYERLYNRGPRDISEEEKEAFLANMFKIENNESEAITAPITLEELWLALKPLKDTAPGPDGISHIYLKKLWQILGPLILEAWNFSMQTNKMPPSHENSYLRLIPKAGKDKLLLANWRPITLSNCDHKLITRVYNSRLIRVLGNYITSTQTAYLKQRNITDNIRLISNAIQLTNYEPGISGSVISLDAQKAFDSVSHSYLKLLLEFTGLGNFVPVLHLLYSNLTNEVIINGRISGKHIVSNGVKQGDALSCTLFILAIEPLLRNIDKNEHITSLRSNLLDYDWPKIYGYADDIVCLTHNGERSKQELFIEYEKFTAMSGLKLNADKTEIYDFGDRPRQNRQRVTKISYLGEHYEIQPVEMLKVNGIYLSFNLERQQQLNCSALLKKMERHFRNWQERRLSLLGKIQIYKTFGISQFLYHLAVVEPSPLMWKEINCKINKFLWNKNMANNSAPVRIKKSTLLAPIKLGGFGMIDLKEVVTALRLKRYFYLLKYNVHPLHLLLRKLTENITYLEADLAVNIDEIVHQNLLALKDKRIKDCNAPEWELESDLILHQYLLGTNIKDIIRPRKRRSNEANLLRRLGNYTLRNVMQNRGRALGTLLKISIKEIVPAITTMARLYRTDPLPDAESPEKIKDSMGRWRDNYKLSSKAIRDIFYEKSLVYPKTAIIAEEQVVPFYVKINCLSNIKNKTGMLRLLQGDVYCAERMYRFGMTQNDKCRRCFEVETIQHLLTECHYTNAVLRMLGVNTNSTGEVLGINLGKAALEIRADIINYLIFRQHVMAPEILIRTTLEKFAKGISYRMMVEKEAQRLMQVIFGTE